MIDRVSREIGVSEDELYKWPARRFWYKHIYLAWESFNKAEDAKRINQK